MAKKSWIEKQKVSGSKFAVRRYNRCPLCGRSRAYMRRFDMCRICFRESASAGLVPGVTKSSW